jgi:isopenicillin N synthase-like dioxygenase
MSRLPVLDLARYRAGAVAETIAEADSACRDLGFLLVAGHQVDTGLISEMRAVSAAFFDQPADYKLRFRMPGTSRGFVPFGTESLAATSGTGAEPDLKQAFAVGPAELVGASGVPVAWPDQPREFASVWRRYHAALRELADCVLTVLTAALGLPAGAVAGQMSQAASFLRVIDYPASQPDQRTQGLRAGAHTDFGALTVLSSDGGGLQVCTPEGNWLDVPVVPGTFVVNIGDVMAIWSGHRWRSTPHRVSRGAARRQTVVFFHNPGLDAVVEPMVGAANTGSPSSVDAVPTFADWLRAKSHRQRSAT